MTLQFFERCDLALKYSKFFLTSSSHFIYSNCGILIFIFFHHILVYVVQWYFLAPFCISLSAVLPPPTSPLRISFFRTNLVLKLIAVIERHLYSVLVKISAVQKYKNQIVYHNMDLIFNVNVIDFKSNEMKLE